MEVFVVDNNSADGSCAMIRENFTEVILIDNHENVGFSKANNQAMRQARGEYMLILNPDTVLQEDTLRKTLAFLDSHPDGGALGVRMIDGKGKFLPESKRALPTPWVSFYKIFGLSALFPRSKRFGQYHLGYLSENEIHQVDILPGAFMMIRKSVLDRIGLFDETYFMYGEDIDLSYRIRLAGFQNYYYPETTIIHYKGESTKKGSFNYVMMFYQAMIIFATRYFSQSNARLFAFFIRISVYFRAAISMVRRVFNRFFMPALDAVFAFLGFLLINPVWESYKFGTEGHHPPEFLRIFVPAYILIWILSVYFSGGYDQPVKFGRITKGMAYGTIVILVLYSLLPEAYRFSRALIVLGSVWTLAAALLIRLLFHLLKLTFLKVDLGIRKRVVVVGREDEALRVRDLAERSGHSVQVVGFISPDRDYSSTQPYLGSLDQVREIIRINRIDELIFCSKDVSTNEIIGHMLTLGSFQTEYKIAPESSDSIIGSNSINTAGELYVIPIQSVGDPANRRVKRLFDLVTGILILLLSPVFMWFFWPRPWKLIWNSLLVTLGIRSWIGYHPEGVLPGYDLPRIKPGVMTPDQITRSVDTLPASMLESNLRYARDYSPMRDFRILLKGIGRLAD
jgi:GT2 family glycosyltransferase